MPPTNFPGWSVPPPKLALSGKEVHIWRVSLDRPLDSLQRLALILSPDEQQRAARFRFERDRHRFIVGRGTLRTILAKYLTTEPEQIQFRYSRSGKPSLDDSLAKSGLVFNLSHSQDLMLCAIAQNIQLGIDLEYLRSVSDLENLTKRFFSEKEYLAIQALPVEQRLESFFHHWTCKEALLKAIGEGLVDLSKVELAIANGNAQLTRWDGETRLHKWQIQLFNPAPDYIAAIAFYQESLCAEELSNPQNFISQNPLIFWQWQHESAIT